MKTRPLWRPAAAAAIAMLLASPAAGGAAGGPGDLSAMSLEDLLNVEVSSVSRKDQQLAHTPAAVFVISQEDIRRSGATSIPELLRMVPGVQVAQISSSQWAVSARGFNSRVSNKMQVLIDGRSVYNDLYGGVFWDQNDVLLEDVERIEVIRGPGATMWGSNAVNGVIDVITKKARDTQGGLAETDTGQAEHAGGAVRCGGHAGDNLYYRAYTKYFDRGNLQNMDGSPAFDGWESVRGGGRLDWDPDRGDTLSFSGDVYRGNGRQELNPTAPYVTGQWEPDTIGFSGGYALGRWERRLDRSDFAVQIYYNREARQEYIGAGTLHTVDFDFQHHTHAGARHDLMWGVGYRMMRDHGDQGHTPFASKAFRDNLLSAFGQDDISLLPERLVLTVGLKLEHNSYTGLEVEPNVRLMWTPTDAQSLWASVSRAARLPSVQDRALDLEENYTGLPITGTGADPGVAGLPVVAQWLGNPRFRTEVVRAYETGYRRQVSGRMALDVAGFVNRYTDLESMEQGVPYVAALPGPTLLVPFTYGNDMHGASWGAETAVTWRPADAWRLAASYSWLNGRLKYGAMPGIPFETNPTLHAPVNTMDLRAAWDVTRSFSLDVSLYYVSGIAEFQVPRHLRTDLRVAYKLGESAEISAGADNLTGPPHYEFVPDDYVGFSRIPRTAYLKLVWRF